MMKLDCNGILRAMSSLDEQPNLEKENFEEVLR